MKKLFSFCFAILISAFIFSQEKETKITPKDVPDAVMKKFTAFYGVVKKVKWEKDGTNYEATFKQNKVGTSILMSADGNIIEKEWEIKKTDVPKAVSDSIMKGFAGFKIEEYAKVEKAGLVTYEAEIAGKKTEKKLMRWHKRQSMAWFGFLKEKLVNLFIPLMKYRLIQ